MRIRGYAQLVFGTTLLLLMLSRCALCNGVYIPQVAVEKMPTIPVQRALITYRNGVETLIVASDVQTESANVGWIVPLPQQPTSIGKGQPGMLVSASLTLRPNLVHDMHGAYALPLGILAFLALPLLAVVFTKDPAARQGKVIEYTGVAIFLLFILSTLLPSSLGVGGGASGEAVKVLSSQRVGNFTVDVISAKAAADLQSWLHQNQLRDLSQPARKIVDDYIGRGWCFAVARLDVAPNILSTPHPLAFTFPIKTPVFPMQLTALAGTKTRVELIVVADQRAHADAFHLTCCDQFYAPDFQAASGLVLANPDVTKHLWNNCIVSKLQADLDPAGMTQDVSIGMVPFTPHRDTVYTPRGLSHLIAAIFLWASIPACLIMAVACAGPRWPSRGPTTAAVALLLFAGLASLVFAAGVEVRSDVTVQAHGRIADILTRSRLRGAIADADLSLDEDDPELGAKVLAAIQRDPDARQNQYQGGDRRWERSPGNICLTEDHQLACYNIDTQAIPISDPLPLRPPNLPTTKPLSTP